MRCEGQFNARAAYRQAINQEIKKTLYSAILTVIAHQIGRQWFRLTTLTFDRGSSSLGGTIIDDGGTRTDGSDLGAIYNVTTVIEATSDIPEWSNAEQSLLRGYQLYKFVDLPAPLYMTMTRILE